jgi:uncharacterized protein YqhQ
MPEGNSAHIHYGGQAVIEGVMIRGPRHMAIAVRAPDGSIVMNEHEVKGPAGLLRRIPLLRGIIVLYETLGLGVRALSWSARVAAGEQGQQITRGQLIVSLSVTLVVAGGIFFVGPVLITGWLGAVTGSEWVEVVAEGLLRIAMLIGYVALIGRMPEIQRVFSYHGAEHRAIHAYEHGRVLTPAAVGEYPNEHPRCGTAFLLTVAVLSFVIFMALGTPPIWVRIIERIVLVPPIAAVAYEVLRLGHRFGETPVIGLVYRPAIWLQRLTTRDPDESQIEVAIAALRHALALDGVTARTAEERVEEPLA